MMYFGRILMGHRLTNVFIKWLAAEPHEIGAVPPMKGILGVALG
jgi:hypothetical protein